MYINFEQISASLSNILLGIFNQNKPAVIAAVNGYISDSKDRLQHLAEGAAKGELSYREVIDHLKEEAINMKDYLLSIGLIIASDIQQIINKAVDIFQFALNSAIGAYTPAV